MSMVEGPNETGQLVERASAAIAQARRLVEENRELQLNASFGIKRLHYRSSFGPKTLKFYSPQDFPEKPRPPYRLFPNQDDGRTFSSPFQGASYPLLREARFRFD